MTIQHLQAVAHALLRYSDVFVASTVEYPGYVVIHLEGGGSWKLGTANGVWGGDLDIVDNGTVDRSIQTTLLPGHADADEIAAALFQAMAEDSPWND